jgi:hypothetical protein
MRVLVDTNILLRSAQPQHPLILSFNNADFKRYDLVTALHLASLLA